MLPSPFGSGLGPRVYTFRGHIYVHCRYGPVTRNLPKGDLVDGLQDFEILGLPPSRYPAIRTTGLLTFALAGLTPAEHTSLTWSQLPDSQISRVRFQTLVCHDRPFQGLERLKRWFVSTPPLLVCLQPHLLEPSVATPSARHSRSAQSPWSVGWAKALFSLALWSRSRASSLWVVSSLKLDRRKLDRRKKHGLAYFW
jgi:hypothetical protein